MTTWSCEMDEDEEDEDADLGGRSCGGTTTVVWYSLSSMGLVVRKRDISRGSPGVGYQAAGLLEYWATAATAACCEFK